MAKAKKNQVKELDGMAMPVSFSTRMLVEPVGLPQGFRTSLTGMERGRYLMLQLPRIPGLSDHVYPDREVKVRYIHEGQVYGFKSTVQHYYVTPYRLLFLAFPKTIERLNLRGTQRVDSYIPATLEVPDSVTPDYKAMVMNISTGGCRLALDAAGKRLPGFEVDGRVMLGFKVVGTDQDVRIKARIKSVDADGVRVYLGLGFNELNPGDEAAIQNYLDSVSYFLEDF